jgi:hypothetical protein
MPGVHSASNHSDIPAELATLTQPDLVKRAKELGVNVRKGKSWRTNN